MNQEDYNIIRDRYNSYCNAFISIAAQVQHLEEEHELDLHVTKDRMWNFLEQLIINKPDWTNQL